MRGRFWRPTATRGMRPRRTLELVSKWNRGLCLKWARNGARPECASVKSCVFGWLEAGPRFVFHVSLVNAFARRECLLPLLAMDYAAALGDNRKLRGRPSVPHMGGVGGMEVSTDVVGCDGDEKLSEKGASGGLDIGSDADEKVPMEAPEGHVGSAGSVGVAGGRDMGADGGMETSTDTVGNDSGDKAPTERAWDDSGKKALTEDPGRAGSVGVPRGAPSAAGGVASGEPVGVDRAASSSQHADEWRARWDHWNATAKES